MYVALDSADVWANQDLFVLNEEGEPTHVGGVPPDYFSETGQLWGCPVFDWEQLAERKYDWWIARLHFCLNMFDLIRIDHFRGWSHSGPLMQLRKQPRTGSGGRPKGWSY